MNKRRILAVVCANGLGHFRRTVGILDRVLARQPDVELTLAAEPWQWTLTRGWPAAARVAPRARTVSGVTDPGVRWSRDPAAYADGRLLRWEDRLRALPELTGEAVAADLVLSDNLAGALAVRPDAALLGSFLWSDVLEHAHGGDPAVAELVAHERALLAAHAPPMLCVDALAMPGVRARTRAIALPWMCEALAAPRADLPPRPRVVIAGGATGAADRLLDGAAELIRTSLADRVALERGSLDGSELELAGAAAVICRPGVGTLTGAVAARVPMVLVHEGANLELAHNAQRIEALGLGRDAGAEPSPEAVLDALRRVLEPGAWAQHVDALVAQPADGLERAATWILERLSL